MSRHTAVGTRRALSPRVRVTVDIPVEHFDRFMELCDRHERPELVLIKQAVYTRRANGDRYIRTMQLQCDIREAEKLLSVAAVLWPPAAAAIENAIVAARRGNG